MTYKNRILAWNWIVHDCFQCLFNDVIGPLTHTKALSVFLFLRMDIALSSRRFEGPRPRSYAQQ